VIKRFLLAVLALTLSGSVFARSAGVIKYSKDGIGPVDSVQALCVAYSTYKSNQSGSLNNYTCVGPTGSAAGNFFWNAQDKNGGAIYKLEVSGITLSYSCPSGGNYDTTYPQTLACPNPPLPPSPPPNQCPVPAGEEHTFGVWEGWGPVGSSLPTTDTVTGFPTSSPQCRLQSPPELVGCYSTPEDGREHYYCIYKAISSGTVPEGSAPPTGAPSTPPAPPGDPTKVEGMPPKTAPPTGNCPKGSVMAGYNSSGTPMCVGSGTAPPSGPPAAPPVNVTKTTTSNPDGSTTTTTNTVTTNSDGSRTTVVDRVTTAPASAGGGTSTEQTKTTSATPSGAAGTETKPQDVNFCKQNPTLSVCRESSVTGTCGQIACMGDAIQCATLRAAAAMECKQRTDEDALKALSQHALGQAAANGNDPDAAGLPSVKNAAVVDMGTMQAAGWIGGGAAFKDVSFTVQGKTFAVPLNKWSSYLVGLRYALMVVAMLVSFRMLSGVILRD
jgi:hypothetical protein